ncbi:MAG: hypothetical protein M1827_002990 [Pycnora praestabilis]|nr:MAG: hypothetical protein M1827_002990 [Pycnora praestabilis]
MAATIRPSICPPKPDLYDGIAYWPSPSSTDYQEAYKAWSLPNDALAPPPGDANAPVLSDEERKHEVMAMLVENVYDAIMANDGLKLPDSREDGGWDSEAHTRLVNQAWVGWSHQDFRPPVPLQRQ